MKNNLGQLRQAQLQQKVPRGIEV